MTSGIAILDVQHGIQHPGRISRGAEVGAYVERELVAQYAAVARFDLLEGGAWVWCMPFAISTYSDRHDWVCQLAARYPRKRIAYLALHAEGAPWDTAHVYHDARSVLGRELAERCCLALDHVPAVAPAKRMRAVRSMSDARRYGLRMVAHQRNLDLHWTVDAWACIRGIYEGPDNVAGVTFEPFSLRVHMPGLKMEDVGHALAKGVLSWLDDA